MVIIHKKEYPGYWVGQKSIESFQACSVIGESDDVSTCLDDSSCRNGRPAEMLIEGGPCVKNEIE